jgi:type II protein arginine methyltransferase
MGCALMGSGQRAKAAALVNAALLRSDHPAIVGAARVVLSHGIPQWHGPMLADAERNAAFEGAISRAVRSGGVVLDIGAGSGLLSLMAARAGAALVYACEADGALAATARDVVELNGYSEKIRVIAKRSTDLDRDIDLAGGADVIVAEIFSDDLINEGALPTLGHAAAALGKSAVRIIPAAASIRVALAYREVRPSPLADVEGFDLSPFERHLLPDRKIRTDDPKLSIRSETQTLFNFDFRSGGPFHGEESGLTMVACGGPANGVVRWIRLHLDEETEYENRPGRGKGSHWAAIFWPLPGGSVDEGESVELHAAHDGALITLWSP